MNWKEERLGQSIRTIYVVALILLIGSLVAPTEALAAGGEETDAFNPHAYVYENYEKYAYQIPMRDGKTLHTQIYSPKDKTRSYPILLVRTPYRVLFHQGGVDGYFGLLGPGSEFIEEGYIFVVQDVRGRFLSEGEFVVVRPNTADWSDKTQFDESTDAYDTIEWLMKNVENSNGKVGVHGVSYPGTNAALSLVNAHPAISVVLIEAPMADVFLGDDYRHNGAQQLLYPFMWLNNIGLADRDGPSEEMPPPLCTGIDANYYEFFLKMGPLSNMNKICFQEKVEFWNGLMKHETYDDFFRTRSLGQYMKGITKPEILVVGSWFDDQDLFGTLYTYQAIEKQNPDASVRLVMGPWNHAKWWDQKKEPWGEIGLPVKETGDYYRSEILFPFFNMYLKGEGSIDLPEATVFESGTNTWQEYSQWPIENSVRKNLYFGPRQELSDKKAAGPKAFDEFVSDPANPVPEIPESKIWGWTAEVMIHDQRFAAEREDVLVYEAGMLQEDLTIVGPIDVNLFVSTTGTDADWVVKLIDVYPADHESLPDYQMLVRGDIMRGKFRNSFEVPEPFEPGAITPVSFSLPDINHTFRKGHKLMVQVQSSWFPMFDRNPQQFLPIFEATAEDFQAATHRLYFGEEYPSGITVHVLPGQ
jgi:putative CocE/NonD family hydrolase